MTQKIATEIDSIYELLERDHPSLRCAVCGSLQVQPLSRGWCDGHNGPTTTDDTVTITKNELVLAIAEARTGKDKMQTRSDDDWVYGHRAANDEFVARCKQKVIGLMPFVYPDVGMLIARIESDAKEKATDKAEIERLRGFCGVIADSLRELRLDPRNKASVEILIAKLDRAALDAAGEKKG